MTHSGPALDDPSINLDVVLATGSSSTFAIQSHDCPAELSPGDSCSVNVTFTPTSATAETGTLQAIDIPTIEPLALTGTGVDDSLRLVPASTAVTLTGRLLGAIINEDIALTNNAPSGTTTGISISNPSSGAPWTLGTAAANPCGTTLAVGASCNTRIVYSPVATGSTSGTVTLAAANMSVTKSIAYSGTATKISASTTILAFGNVGLNTAQTHATTVTITNPSTLDTASGCAVTATAPFAIVNSTCGATLNPSGTCTYQAQLTAQTTAGALTGTATMTCAVGGSVAVDLTATGVRADAAFAWSGTSAFGNVDIGSSSTQTLTLTHTGAAYDASTINLDVALAAGSSSTFVIQTDDCPAVLDPGDTCTADVTFTPTNTTAQTGTLNADDTPTIVPLALSGTGVDTTLRLVPAVTTFSLTNRLIGTTINQDVALTNNAPVGTTTGIGVAAPSSGAPWTSGTAAANPCGATLAVAASCNTRIVYAPTVVGSTSGTVTLSATNMVGTKTISYSGTAIQITESASTLAFGAVDLNEVKTHATVVTITNPSTLDTASGCGLTVDAPFTIVNSTCGATLNPSATCTYQVQVPAQVVSGPLSASATMACTVGGSVTAAVTATINDMPNVTWDVSAGAAYGNQDTDGGAMNRTFTLTNTDVSAVTLTGFGFGTSSTGFSIIAGGTTCTSTTVLAVSGQAGDSCTVQLRFDPSTDTTATSGETVTLSADITLPLPYSYIQTFTGTGTTMALSSSASSIAFATAREVGQAGSDAQTITVTNTGTRSASLSYSALTNPPFIRSGTCGAALAANATCNLTVTFSAAAAAASHSVTLTASDTLNGNTKSVAIALTATTTNAPSLQLIDDRGNTTYASTITTSDITGAVDDANNILDLSPAFKDVSYTLKNNVASSSTVNTVSVGLTYKSGTNSRMALVSNTCAGATLAANATCTFGVRYTPVASSETSTYEIAVSSVSTVSGTAYPAAVTNVVGTSRKAADLSMNSITSLGPIIASSTVNSSTYVVTNVGDQTATGIAYAFSGTNSALFTKDNTVATPCGASLAGGATCNVRITMTPGGAAGAFSASFDITATQASAALSKTIYGSAFASATVGNDIDGVEGDMAGDSSRFYLVSRFESDTNAYKPLLTVCSKTAGNIPDTATCTRTDIGALVSAAADSNLAGNLTGSGPRIAVQGTKIIVVVQNKDTDPGMGGDGAGGTVTAIICQKPTVGNAVTSCSKFVMNSDASSGQFPSLAVSTDQIIVASTSSTQTLLMTTCKYDSTSATTDGTTLTGSTCTKKDFGTANGGWYTSVSMVGGQAVAASYDRISTPYGLRISACNTTFNGTIYVYAACESSVVDTTSLVDTGSTLYPGAYPHIIFDGTKLYSVHQQGETEKMRLRLTDCDVSSLNVLSNCSSQTVSSITATGANPRIGMYGTSSAGRLWITASTLADPSDNISDSSLKVWNCALPLSAGSCTGVAAHATQATFGIGVIYSRSFYLDNTNHILVAPFEATYTGVDRRNGIFSIGLWPDF